MKVKGSVSTVTFVIQYSIACRILADPYPCTLDALIISFHGV
jgi:hypothetical protein